MKVVDVSIVTSLLLNIMDDFFDTMRLLKMVISFRMKSFLHKKMELRDYKIM